MYSQYAAYIDETLCGEKRQIVLKGDTLNGYVQRIPNRDFTNLLTYVAYKQACTQKENEEAVSN